MNPKPKVGISACLLGHKVRYDGGHKRDPWLVTTLGKIVTYVPVCPEVECGLGMPRERMRLTGHPASPRLVIIRSGRDVTDPMVRWIRRKLKEPENKNLCGFIFKSRSPSCGVRDVRIFLPSGKPVYDGIGLFACAFRQRFSDVPVTDERQLQNPQQRRAFLRRVLAIYRRRFFMVT